VVYASDCAVVEQALVELSFTHGAFAVQLEFGHKNTIEQNSLYLKEMRSAKGDQIILAGRINHLAEGVVEISGVSISTSNSSLKSDLGTKETLRLLGDIKQEFRQRGFKQLRIVGVRRTGGNVGKTIQRVINLD
jgi:hypothetical protein